MRTLALIAIILAGGGSSFGSLDLDELGSPDFGVELSALPATFDGSETVVARGKEPRSWPDESPMLSRMGPTILRDVPQSLRNFYCWYEHIPERGPPLLL